MIGIIKKTAVLALSITLLNCKEAISKSDQPAVNADQKMELLVDGNKKTFDMEAIVSSSYTSSHLLIGYLSEKDNIQLTISAYLSELKPGTYQVYDCKSASTCDQTTPDNNQVALYGPFPKDPLPPVNLFRTSYYAPQLGLSPLVLNITSITDEQQPGIPFKTKKIKGTLLGNLAYVEQQQGGYDWHVVGNTTKIEGSFDIFCGIR